MPTSCCPLIPTLHSHYSVPFANLILALAARRPPRFALQYIHLPCAFACHCNADHPDRHLHPLYPSPSDHRIIAPSPNLITRLKPIAIPHWKKVTDSLAGPLTRRCPANKTSTLTAAQQRQRWPARRAKRSHTHRSPSPRASDLPPAVSSRLTHNTPVSHGPARRNLPHPEVQHLKGR